VAHYSADHTTLHLDLGVRGLAEAAEVVYGQCYRCQDLVTRSAGLWRALHMLNWACSVLVFGVETGREVEDESG